MEGGLARSTRGDRAAPAEITKGVTPRQAHPLKREEKIHIPMKDRERMESWRPERTGRAQEVGFQLLLWEGGFGLMAVRVWEAQEIGGNGQSSRPLLTLQVKVTFCVSKKWIYWGISAYCNSERESYGTIAFHRLSCRANPVLQEKRCMSLLFLPLGVCIW